MTRFTYLQKVRQKLPKATDSTIRNCFQKGGFAGLSINENYFYDPIPLTIPNDIPKTELLTIDDDFQTGSTLTEKDICSQMMTGNEELDDNGDDDDNDDPAPQPLSHRKILNVNHTMCTSLPSLQRYGGF